MATFGVTVADLETEMFAEQGLQGRERGPETAARLIETIGAEVTQRVRAVRIDPAAIDQASSPEAFAFCRTTVMFGVAAELMTQFDQSPDVAAAREEKYQDRLKQITREPHVVLRDVPTRSGSGSIRHVFV